MLERVSGAFVSIVVAAGAAYGTLVTCGALLRLSGGQAPWWEPVPWLAVSAGLVVFAFRRRSDGSTAPLPAAEPSVALGWPEVGLLLPALLALVIVAAVHLDRVPGMRADETTFLQFSTNYARAGRFEIRVGEELSAEPLWVMGGGPPLLLPAALALKLGNIDLATARAVAGFYLFALGVLVWWSARSLGGPVAGLVALVSLLAMSETTNTGRMFMGDYAACAFLVAGLVLWLRSLEQPTAWLCICGAGLALGLMTLTKNSFVIAATGFLAFTIYDRMQDRVVRLRHLLIPIVLVVAVNAPWELYRGAQGSRSMLEFTASSSSGEEFTRFDLSGLVGKAKELLARPEFLLAIAGLVFGVSRGGRQRRATALIGLTAITWIAWFLTFRWEMHRYLIAPSILALLVAAPLVATALTSWRTRTDPLGLATVVAVVYVGLALPAARAASRVGTVLAAPQGPVDESRLADAVRERIGSDAPLHASQVPLGMLFFEDRPISLVSPNDAHSLDPGEYYLVRMTDPQVDPDRFEHLFRIGDWKLTRRRPDR